MGKAITLKQGLQGLMALATNVGWETIDGDMFQRTVVDDPMRAGAELTAFLRNRACVMRGEPRIIQLDPNEKFDPFTFISPAWKIWKGPRSGDGLEGKEEIDHRSCNLTSLNLSETSLLTCFWGDETFVIGEDKLNRLRKLRKVIKLGGNVFMALWNDYLLNKDSSCLEWLRKYRDVVYLDFFGTILRGPDGLRYVIYLFFDHSVGVWRWDNCLLSYMFQSPNKTAGIVAA